MEQFVRFEPGRARRSHANSETRRAFASAAASEGAAFGGRATTAGAAAPAVAAVGALAASLFVKTLRSLQNCAAAVRFDASIDAVHIPTPRTRCALARAYLARKLALESKSTRWSSTAAADIVKDVRGSKSNCEQDSRKM
jgi:hypothetical protein